MRPHGHGQRAFLIVQGAVQVTQGDGHLHKILARDVSHCDKAHKAFLQKDWLNPRHRTGISEASLWFYAIARATECIYTHLSIWQNKLTRCRQENVTISTCYSVQCLVTQRWLQLKLPWYTACSRTHTFRGWAQYLLNVQNFPSAVALTLRIICSLQYLHLCLDI